MSRFKLYATNVLTALVTAALVSLFWIAAYSSRRSAPEPGQGVDVPLPQATADLMPKGAPASRRGLIRGPTGVAIPVVGVVRSALTDTFTQARAGGSRVHDAIDIMAPEGTPVVAAAPGRVEKLFFSQGGGGITAYLRSPDGRWSYYYAHLRDYAPGLREGQIMRQGDAIGQVGHTGNASAEGPHLHFAIHRMKPGEGWSEGTAINPYPLLAGKAAGR